MFVCSDCGWRGYDPTKVRCPKCGGILRVHLDIPFREEDIAKRIHSMWRYYRFYPYISMENIVSLGEGWTPTIEFEEKLYLKLDYLNPTGSFKDRGSSVSISALVGYVPKDIVLTEDSSGNAGASIAAYAARAGFRAKIFVPSSVSAFKERLIMAYGAEVVKVAGSRLDVTRAAMESGPGHLYIGHVYNPIFRDGMRTVAYELFEVLGDNIEYVFVPVSAGTLLLGVIEGFKHMYDSGVINKMPKIMGVQTEAVSPLYHKFYNLEYSPPAQINTIADALVSTNPPLLDEMVRALRSVDGDVVVVNEEEILDAYRYLAEQGIFVEPSSATAFAGYQKVRKGVSVVVLTGFGVKGKLFVEGLS